MINKQKIFFFILLFFNRAHGDSFVSSIDSIINKQKRSISPSSLSCVKKAINKVEDSLKQKKTFHNFDRLIHHKAVFDFFNLDESEGIKDLKIALGAKIYFYYLHYCEKNARMISSVYGDAMEHWRYEDYCENKPLLKKNITRWFDFSEYKKQILQNIELLKQKQKKTFSFLGMVRQNKDLFHKFKTCDDLEQILAEVTVIQNSFFHKNRDQNSQSSVYEILMTAIDQAEDFQLSLQENYEQCRPPSHIRYHCIKYASGFAAACLFVAWYQHYKDSFNDWGNIVSCEAQKIYEKNLKKPIESINNALFSKDDPAPYLDWSEEQRKLDVLIECELRKRDPFEDKTKWAVEGAKSIGNMMIRRKPVEKSSLEASEEEIAIRKKDPEAYLKKVDAIYLKHPEINFVGKVQMGERLLLRNLILVKKQFNIASQKSYDEYQKNRITIALAALVPSMLIAGGGLYGTNRLYHKLFKRKMSYDPIKKLVRELEVLLNNAMHESPSFEKEGRLYFLTKQLRSVSKLLTMEEDMLFESDVVDLQSKKLTYEQKFNIIRRMYHTHAFLLPGAD